MPAAQREMRRSGVYRAKPLAPDDDLSIAVRRRMLHTASVCCIGNHMERPMIGVLASGRGKRIGWIEGRKRISVHVPIWALVLGTVLLPFLML
jgi:hypothetical protein